MYNCKKVRTCFRVRKALYCSQARRACESFQEVPTKASYNKKVFIDLGITEIPSNLDEFVALMDKIKAAGIAPLAGSWAEPWSAQIVHMIASE